MTRRIATRASIELNGLCASPIRFIREGTSQHSDRAQHLVHMHNRSTGKGGTTTRGRGSQDTMASHTPQLRIISYSPMTIESEGRLADICHHFRRSADMIMLQGTGTKDFDVEGQPKSTKCGSFWGLQWGWTTRSQGAIKSCGIMILFNSKRFPADSCSKMYTSRQALWCRAGAVRLSARDSDFPMICLYFSPRTNQGAHAQARYRSTVQELVNWTEQVVADALHRPLPTIALDFNHGLGRWKGRQIVSEAISAGCTREEGFAGKLFRKMMERQRLYAASGHFRPLPTYHGTQGNTSTIDFVVLPQSYASLSVWQQYLGKVEDNFSTPE